MKIETSKVTLNYVCVECNTTSQQRLSDLVCDGTAICENCGDDMDLTDVVDVAE
jgi:DNA-directed RNA polymerase subunit RPC12/RpoP